MDWTFLRASRGKETRGYHERRDLTIITFPKDQAKGLGDVKKSTLKAKGTRKKEVCNGRQRQEG
jgi:hypothetical protein